MDGSIKERAKELVKRLKTSEWGRNSISTAMADLLEEVANAPEVEPNPVRWLIYHDEFLRAEVSTKREANGYQKQGFRVVPLYAATAQQEPT